MIAQEANKLFNTAINASAIIELEAIYDEIECRAVFGYPYVHYNFTPLVGNNIFIRNKVVETLEAQGYEVTLDEPTVDENGESIISGMNINWY